MNCLNYRRFGVELEFNTPSGIVNKKLPKDEYPEGAMSVAKLINRAVTEKVTISGYGQTNNNDIWVVKSDSSCGIEVCTPILKGWRGLKSLLNAQTMLSLSGISCDNRCSLHVHTNVADLDTAKIASVLAHYVKFEPVFMDSVPISRKNNRYCSLIGYEFQVNLPPAELVNKLSDNKYYSANCYQNCGKKAKATIEFRIGENNLCLDPYGTKCWIRFLLHFVETTSKLSYPSKFNVNDKNTGLSWLDLEDMVEMLGFNKELSPGLTQVRDWFFYRTFQNLVWDTPGLFSFRIRKKNLDFLLKNHPNIVDFVPKSEDIFSENFVV